MTKSAAAAAAVAVALTPWEVQQYREAAWQPARAAWQWASGTAPGSQAPVVHRWRVWQPQPSVVVPAPAAAVVAGWLPESRHLSQAPQ